MKCFRAPVPARTGAHGTFKDVEAHLPRVAEMGFDVLYLPPIHPIGNAFRKGKNNNPTCQPDEPGSPWGIGAAEGGHKAIHPELGTLEDFKRLLGKAREIENRNRARHRLAMFAGPSVGAANIRRGSSIARTARFNTRKIRPRNIRTFIRSISRATTGRGFGGN